ncbi:MAG: hypothetical protein DRP78_04505 [Candidatus Omnitrophota bacterium]|nr:MAG: hypothetical protein DRP78_04505 [Candidatus Omnitrophota bacterium]
MQKLQNSKTKINNTFIRTNFKQIFEVKLNINQTREFHRLIYEIQRSSNLSFAAITDKIKLNSKINHIRAKNKISLIKDILIELRFPITNLKQKISPKDVFLPIIKPSPKETHPVQEFKPLKIFVDQKASKSDLTNKFRTKFPEIEIQEFKNYQQYLNKNKFSMQDLKKPFIFITEQDWDFIKPCPCTKYHLRCNYWIFNLGFGCPFDCSYCFLQQYANFPGIILPANLTDFFTNFDKFFKKINRPIRIGTGEFCDSLALDYITDYSTQVINFFRDKPVLFELKTKSNKIDNLLKISPSKNIIISWSLNPQSIISKEELCTVSLEQRIDAAKKVSQHGYALSFHFDPIFYSHNWEVLYKDVIKKLYIELSPPFKWISLGTLRGMRKLKTVSEQRFPKSNIFYGELFLAEDKKLRYPKFLRKEIYQKMLKWIREYDTQTPVYLCMEDQDVWSVMDKKFSCSAQIEKYLIG